MSNKIAVISEALCRNRKVGFAYLFGSRAASCAACGSDWDIAVFFVDDPRKGPSWTVFNLEAELSRKIGAEVHIVALNDLDSPVFLFQVVSNGQVLANNNPVARVRYEAGVLRKYHDWRYFLDRHMGVRRLNGVRMDKNR
jgi:predicted nucleotidyltransferase